MLFSVITSNRIIFSSHSRQSFFKCLLYIRNCCNRKLTFLNLGPFLLPAKQRQLANDHCSFFFSLVINSLCAVLNFVLARHATFRWQLLCSFCLVLVDDRATVTDWTFTDRTFTEDRYRLGHLPTGSFTD